MIRIMCLHFIFQRIMVPLFSLVLNAFFFTLVERLSNLFQKLFIRLNICLSLFSNPTLWEF